MLSYRFLFRVPSECLPLEAGTATEPLAQVPEGRHSAVAGGRGGDSATFLRFVSPDAVDAGALLKQTVTSENSD